jgi:signal transduction histidine kinase
LRIENAQAGVRNRAVGDDLAGALREVRRLDVLVEGLLALARAEREVASPQTVDVALVARERQRVWVPPAAERKVDVEVDVPIELEALATPGHLEQVLDNLISNALDVSPEGGRIDVHADRNNGWVEVHVADRGPGMSEEQRRRATDRFWRAPDGKRGGSGLGLAIVHRLVEADGGTLDLREAPTGGLDVVVRLRTADGTSEQP